MSRAERLLDLINLLRLHRQPVSGQSLAEELGVSLRTLYRDIATLQGQGADIVGEAGLGYVLRPGFLLPPLMFPAEEIEALVLGMRWVAARGDPGLQKAANTALTRIAAVLPTGLTADLETTALFIGPGAARPENTIDPAQLRHAIRSERKLTIQYHDADGSHTARVIWPFGLAFFEQVQVLLGWCELRADFRSFRVDRIASVETHSIKSPKRRQVLMTEWRQKQAAQRTTADRN